MRLRLLVSGTVQGVGFREATRSEAVRLGVAGWVRNLPDGRVELVAQGSEAAVRTLAAWCRRGPPGARVQDMEASDEPEQAELGPGFHVRR